jgi:aspartokinase-like uncharacterized kinase
MTGRWQRGLIVSASGGRRGAVPGVVKLGGSLLARNDWPTLLAELVGAETDGRPRLFIVGGGAVVDGLRRIDAAVPQSPALMHRLAIEAMRVTARLVAASADLPVVADSSTGRSAVLDVPAWLDRDGRFGMLPVGWHVTSDSIAAFVAATLESDLLLAKTVPPPCQGSGGPMLQRLAEVGWVDAFFPVAAASLSSVAWACPTSVPPPGVCRTGGERLGSSDGSIT